MEYPRYRNILLMVLFLILVDLLINGFTDLLRLRNVVLLVIYVVQDLCLIVSIIVICLLFFSTYFFQAGLVGILLRKFRSMLMIVTVYLGLTIGFHVWTMTARWDNLDRNIWSNGYWAFYVIHRSLSACYYYVLKRAAMVLADQKFHSNSDYIRSQFSQAVSY